MQAKHLSELVKFVADGARYYNNYHNQLTQIAYSELDTATEKLSKIKKVLLTTSNTGNATSGTSSTDDMLKLIGSQSNLSALDLEQATQLMDKISEPYVKCDKLRQSIGAIMRTSGKSATEKLEQITDLLI